MTTKNTVKKLVEGYKRYIGSDVKVQKKLGALGTSISKIELKETNDIYK